MARIYLHDIPVDTFIKYYMNDEVSSTDISSNARYQPQYTEYIASNVYQYRYVINDLLYSVYTVNQPKLNIDSTIARELYNYDNDPRLPYSIRKKNTEVHPSITQHSPSINASLYAKLCSITNDDELTEYSKTTNSEYTLCNDIYYVSNNTYNTIKSQSGASLNKETGIITYQSKKYDKMFTSESNGVYNLETQIYYIPIKDHISNHLHNLSCYPYYAHIADKVFYSVKFDMTNNRYMYVIDEGDTTNGTVPLVDMFKDKNNANLYSISDKTKLYDPKYKCYYYAINIRSTTVEAGRLYILPKYNIIKTNADNNVIYTDTYTDRDIVFPNDEQPVSPIVKYNNYMRMQKASLYTNPEQDQSDATKYTSTNKIYYNQYKNVDEIGFAFQYTQVKRTPATGVSNLPTTPAYVSTTDRSVTTTYSQLSTGTDLNIAYTIINWLSNSNPFAISATSVYSNEKLIDISGTTPTQSVQSQSSSLSIADLKYVNKYAKVNGNKYVMTDYVYSHNKTLFTTSNINYIKKLETYGSGDESTKDTIQTPYLSQGFAIENFSSLADSEGVIVAKLINKPFYKSFKAMNKISKFIVIDDISTTTTKASKEQILAKCPVYHFTVNEETVQDENHVATFGNEKFYKVVFTPLGKYIADFIVENNTATHTFKLDKLSNGSSYTYTINSNIVSPSKLTDATPSNNPWDSLKKAAKLDDVKAAFKAYNLLNDYHTMMYTPVAYGNTTREVKKYNALNTLFPSVINSNISTTYTPTPTMDKFTMNEYFTSLFKNLLYINSASTFINPGGLCTDVVSNNSYFGFINYDRTFCSFDYTTNVIDNSNTTFEYSNVELSNNEIYALEQTVSSKNVLERLFNYRKYTINAEEIEDLRAEKINEKHTAETYTQETISNIEYNKINEHRYDIQRFDISDIVDKCMDLYTEYLFTDSRKKVKINDEYVYNVDNVIELGDLISLKVGDDEKLEQLYKIGADEPFLRRDIDNYFVKLNDTYNDFVYTNNNVYTLRYEFTHTQNDTDVFIELLSKITK